MSWHDRLYCAQVKAEGEAGGWIGGWRRKLCDFIYVGISYTKRRNVCTRCTDGYGSPYTGTKEETPDTAKGGT